MNKEDKIETKFIKHLAKASEILRAKQLWRALRISNKKDEIEFALFTPDTCASLGQSKRPFTIVFNCKHLRNEYKSISILLHEYGHYFLYASNRKKKYFYS